MGLAYNKLPPRNPGRYSKAEISAAAYKLAELQAESFLPRIALPKEVATDVLLLLLCTLCQT